MSESDDALSKIETISQQRVDLQKLVESASTGLQRIEPWNKATSTNATVRYVVKDVTRNAQMYFEALDLSIQTVDTGYKFSLYSESLCDLLLDPRMNVDQLRGFIQDLRGVARESHEAAKRTSEKFRLVRQGLNQVTANLAPKIQGLRTTVQLPALMSMLQGQLQRATNRQVESHGVEAALEMLHKAADDISALAADVDAFADWWVMAETMLSAVQSHVEQLNAERVSALRVKGVKREWTAIKGEYLNYKIHVSKLQDYYPSNRQPVAKVRSRGSFFGNLKKRRIFTIWVRR